MKQLNKPFHLIYTIELHGITRSNGHPVLTGPMIVDKIVSVLEKLIIEDSLLDFKINVQKVLKSVKTHESTG